MQWQPWKCSFLGEQWPVRLRRHFHRLWLRTPQGPCSVLLSCGLNYARLHRKPAKNMCQYRQQLTISVMNIGPCAGAPTSAKRIPSFCSRLHGMSSYHAWKTRCTHAFIMTDECRAIVCKTTGSTSQLHSRFYLTVHEAQFQIWLSVVRMLCITTSWITGGIGPFPHLFINPVIPFSFRFC